MGANRIRGKGDQPSVLTNGRLLIRKQELVGARLRLLRGFRAEQFDVRRYGILIQPPAAWMGGRASPVVTHAASAVGSAVVTSARGTDAV